jgi:hypothetical protein
MKKKISKLQLKKTVITIMNNAAANPQPDGYYVTKPVVTCRFACPVSTGCPN